MDDASIIELYFKRDERTADITVWLVRIAGYDMVEEQKIRSTIVLQRQQLS